AEQILVDPHDAWLDPPRRASERVIADPERLLDALTRALDDLPVDLADPWTDEWQRADGVARAAIDGLLDASDEPFEGRIARDVVAALPDGASFAVASSMPIRDVETFAAPREGIRWFANRGVNGIDGFCSTVLGVASCSPGPTIALLGDLCFLHDTNG